MGKSKKILAFLMTVFMLMTSIPTAVWAEAMPITGELSGKLKVKGPVAVDVTLTADYKKVKPEGITDDLVTFIWSRKISDTEKEELSKEKTYKVTQEDLGFELILQIQGIEEKGITGKLEVTTHVVTQTEEEAKILEEQELLKENEEEVIDEISEEEILENPEEILDEDVIEEEIIEEVPEETIEESIVEEYIEEPEVATDVEAPVESEETTDVEDTVESEEIAEEETVMEEATDSIYAAEIQTESETGILEFAVSDLENEEYTPQYITVTNTGNVVLNFLPIAPEHFMVQDIEEPLNPGESIELWIVPRTGLEVGQYTDDITYITEEGVEASFTANLVVSANTLEESDVEEPSIEEPSIEEPNVEEPDVEEPSIEEPSIEEPSVEEPDVEEPDVEEPGVEEPETERVYNISAEASELNFETLTENYEIVEAKDFYISNTGTETVTLIQPQISSGFFEYQIEGIETDEDVQILPGESIKLTFVPVQGLTQGNYEESFEFKINESDDVSLFLTLKVNVTEAAIYKLTANTQNVDFGTVTEGYTSVEKKIIELKNEGNRNIEIGALSSNIYDFNISDAITLAPMETMTIEISPKSGLSVGEYFEDVVISNSADLEMVISVNFKVKKKQDKLTGISELKKITGIPNGSEKTVEALKLPKKVKISTTAGEKEATINWDMNSCKYDPAIKVAQNFRVKGTINLPDGVENSDNISLAVSVYVSVKAAEEETTETVVEESKITGIQPNATYTTNDKITFTAVGGGMDNEHPNKGALREKPLYWNVLENKAWEGAPYTATFRMGAAGDYTLTVVFKEQKYDGSNWADTGKRTKKQVAFKVTKAQVTITPALTQTPDSQQKKSVATGDTTNVLPFVIILIVAAGCIGGIVIYRKKK